ncbi:unnamed protein product [Litomosoides sigmodontis]|uniref:V-type proton ATPase subunit S1/VOA1 transmembrane domain-containing protein n=1 Tax=Litomosoides sigmodontis TaxID=42156 RepID=A0A3P6TQ06_LITSI|nr:unnamed protein product [Litomosoides sigmodontis]
MDGKTTIDDLVASSKVLAIAIKDFSLPKFGIYAQAYGAENSVVPFSSVLRIFPYQKAIPMENQLMVTSDDDNARKPTVAVDYITFDSLNGLHDLVLSNEKFKGYQTVIISSQDAFKKELIRHKRVSSDVNFDDEPSLDEVSKTTGRQQLSLGDRHDMPIVLPVNSQKTTCLLYMEAFEIIIPKSPTYSYIMVGSENKNKYLAKPGYWKCSANSDEGGSSFVIDVEVGENVEDIAKQFFLKSGTTITFQLDFVRNRNGYWYLDGTTLKNNFKITAMNGEQDLTVISGTATNPVDVGAVFNQNFACCQTDAIIFNTSSDNSPHIGIVLRNFEVSLGLKGDKARFGYHTKDCIGTFTAGTWMGTLISVVLISILMFGVSMLQSIHTMDRFDDLKQKPINPGSSSLV